MRIIDHGYEGPQRTAYALLVELARELADRRTKLVCEIFHNVHFDQLQLVLVDHDQLCGHDSYKSEIESDDDGIALPKLTAWVDGQVASVRYVRRLPGRDQHRQFDLAHPGSVDRLKESVSYVIGWNGLPSGEPVAVDAREKLLEVFGSEWDG